MPREVQHEITHGELVEMVVAGAAAERADPRQELFERKGLGEIVVGASIQAADTVGHRVARREHQDWRFEALPTQLAGDLETVHFGEHHIQHHKVVCAALGTGEPFQPIVCHLDPMADVGKRALNDPRDTRIVLYE